jgi:hypothetical protein
MRLSTSSLVLLATLSLTQASKDSQEIPAYDLVPAVSPSSDNATLPLLDPQLENIPHQSYEISPHLQDFINQLHKRDQSNQIEARQAAGGVGGGVAAPKATVPTQVPTVTTFGLSGKQIVYTQLFSDVPEQWPTPSSGKIGLGTITGQIGVVKTNAASVENLRARGAGAAAVGAGVGGYLLL